MKCPRCNGKLYVEAATEDRYCLFCGYRQCSSVQTYSVSPMFAAGSPDVRSPRVHGGYDKAERASA